MDDGELIERVREFSVLYDKSNPKFRNKLVKENAWKTIGALLSQSPEECEQRWSVLRNKYSELKRKIRCTPSGSEATPVLWPYFKIMTFLDTFIKPRRTLSKATNFDFEKPSDSASFYSGVDDIITENETIKSPSNIEIESQSDPIESQTEIPKNIAQQSEARSEVSTEPQPSTSGTQKQPISAQKRKLIALRENVKPPKKRNDGGDEQLNSCLKNFNELIKKNVRRK